MAVEFSWEDKKPETTKEEIHAREMDALNDLCQTCKSYRKGNKHDGCEIRWKLYNQDSRVAWKQRHLFFDKKKSHNGYMVYCKNYRER